MKKEQTPEEKRQSLIERLVKINVHGKASTHGPEHAEQVRKGYSNPSWSVESLEAVLDAHDKLEARLKKARKKNARLRKK